MKKHIRVALKMAGLRESDVSIVQAGKHPHIRLNGREIVTSSTPRNVETAARMLARDLRLALNS